MTTPRPVFLSSLFSAFKRIGRPFTVTEQNGELRKSLQVKLTAATVGVVSKFVMERALGVPLESKYNLFSQCQLLRPIDFVIR